MWKKAKNGRNIWVQYDMSYKEENTESQGQAY